MNVNLRLENEPNRLSRDNTDTLKEVIFLTERMVIYKIIFILCTILGDLSKEEV